MFFDASINSASTLSRAEWVDSHAHLNFKAFYNDYPKIIKNCLEENLWLINVGSQYADSQQAVAIAENYEKGVWAAIGLHPTNAEDENFDYQKYLELAKNPKVVAIGETGLDYYHIKNPESRIRQKKIFLDHLKLAQEINKPLIIHCREAHEELAELLKAESCKPKAVPGVIHCFTGNQKQAKQYIEMGFYLGFTGIITYSSAYDEIIKSLPLERILIETDCPYLTPVPRRGQRNEPAYVKHTAQKIASLRGLFLEEIAKQTTSNALNLFQILL